MSIRLIAVALGIVGLIGSVGILANASHSSEFETHTSFYTNGQAKETAEFTEGIRNGHCTRFYEDGSLKAEGDFAGGRMTGDWVWKTPGGELDLSRSGTYEKGRRISS